METLCRSYFNFCQAQTKCIGNIAMLTYAHYTKLLFYHYMHRSNNKSILYMDNVYVPNESKQAKDIIMFIVYHYQLQQVRFAGSAARYEYANFLIQLKPELLSYATKQN